MTVIKRRTHRYFGKDTSKIYAVFGLEVWKFYKISIQILIKNPKMNLKKVIKTKSLIESEMLKSRQDTNPCPHCDSSNKTEEFNSYTF